MSNTNLLHELGISRAVSPAPRSPTENIGGHERGSSEANPLLLKRLHRRASERNDESESHDEASVDGSGGITEGEPITKRRKIVDTTEAIDDDLSRANEAAAKDDLQPRGEPVPTYRSFKAQNSFTTLALDPNKTYSARFVGNGPVYIEELIAGKAFFSTGSASILQITDPFIPGNNADVSIASLGASFDTIGNKIVAEVLGQTINNANVKTIAFTFNGTVLGTLTLPSNQAQVFMIKMEFIRIGELTWGHYYTLKTPSGGVVISGQGQFSPGAIPSNADLGLRFNATALSDIQVNNVVVTSYSL